MEFPVYVFIVAVVVAAVSLSISIKSTRRRKAHAAGLERYQNIMAAARVADNIEAQDELLEVWTKEAHRIIWVEYRDIAREFEILYWVITHKRSIDSLYEDLTTSADIEERIKSLSKILHIYTNASYDIVLVLRAQAVISQELAKEQLLDILQSYLDSLAIQARTDSDAFTKMTVIRSEIFEMSSGKKISNVDYASQQPRLPRWVCHIALVNQPPNLITEIGLFIY